jgi:hypothetical protein
MSRIPIFSAGLFIALLAPAAVRADDRSHANDASAHFERGTTYYGEGDYAAAVVEFRKAYDLAPAWQVLFNLGQSYFQLRDYANALLTLRRFASEGGDRIPKEDRTTLDNELPDLANRVGRVVVQSNERGASVLVDDQPSGNLPLAEPLWVSAGLRKITVVAEGHAPLQRNIAVTGGDTLTVQLDFSEGATAPIEAVTTPRELPEHRGALDHTAAYVTWAVAGAGLAAGGVFGVLTMSDKSKLDQSCSASRACPPSSQGQIDALQRDGLVSTVSFVAGGVLAAAGLGLYLVAKPAQVKREPGASLVFGPGFVAGSF